MMDVLSGALTGSGVATEVCTAPTSPRARSRAGHLFLAMTPTALGDPEGYESQVQQLIDEVKGVPLAQGFDEVFYPGELRTGPRGPTPRQAVSSWRRSPCSSCAARRGDGCRVRRE